MLDQFAYLREASASLLVQRIRAMRRPQTVERATSTDLALFCIKLIACDRVHKHIEYNANLQKILHF